jgi:hypothetical protein
VYFCQMQWDERSQDTLILRILVTCVYLGYNMAVQILRQAYLKNDLEYGSLRQKSVSFHRLNISLKTLTVTRIDISSIG